jgi:hypothetical protein
MDFSFYANHFVSKPLPPVPGWHYRGARAPRGRQARLRHYYSRKYGVPLKCSTGSGNL